MLAKLPSPLFILLLGFGITQTNGSTADKDNSAIAQTSPQSAPQEIVQPGEVLALPGELDKIPVFNSNSPEWIKEDKLSQGGVRFRKPSLDFPFFRGTVRLL